MWTSGQCTRPPCAVKRDALKLLTPILFLPLLYTTRTYTAHTYHAILPLSGLAHWTDINVSTLGSKIGWTPARKERTNERPLRDCLLSCTSGMRSHLLTYLHCYLLPVVVAR